VLTAFQFHFGSIGRRQRTTSFSKYCVSIPLWFDWKGFDKRPENINRSFNSTLVRLEVISLINRQDIKKVSIPLWFDWKVVMPSVFSAELSQFQFHFGSIGSLGVFKAPVKPFRFNSTLVRLEVLILFFLVVDFASFNSTLVRLEVDENKQPIKMDNAFQFHFGSIGSLDTHFGSGSIACFNSTLVRLEAIIIILLTISITFQFHFGSIGSYDGGAEVQNIFVSIPLWFDWKLSLSNANRSF